MTAPRTLRPGEAVPLSDFGPNVVSGLTVTLAAVGAAPDLLALAVGSDGKVRTDDDLVFYNNPASTDSAVAWTGQADGRQTLRIAPSTVHADTERIVIGAACGPLDIRTPGLLTVTVGDGAGVR